MKAEILCIGSELLLGDIVNTNAQYLSRKLAEIGISVYYQSVVGDNAQRVKEALEIALKRNDIVITTGGLGPTKDDLSKEVIAQVMGEELEQDDKAYDNMKKRVFLFTHKKPSTSNEKQAMVPKGGITLYNDHGTAPGFILEKNGKHVIVLPGVPREMKAMYEKDVVPYLKKFPHGVYVSQTLCTCGISEASVNDKLNDMLDNYNPTLAPYAKDNGTELRITAFSHSPEKAKEMMAPIVNKIRSRLGEHIYSERGESLEEVICRKLMQKHRKITIIDGGSRGQLLAKLCTAAMMDQVIAFNRVAVNEESFRQFHNSDDYCCEAYAKLLAEQFYWQLGTVSLIITLPYKLDEDLYSVHMALCVDEGCFSERLELYGTPNEITSKLCSKAFSLLLKHL